MPDAGLAAAFRGTEELDDSAIRSPCRCFVLPAVGKQPLARSVRTHRADAEVTGDAGISNQVAARAPFWGGEPSAAKADPALVRPVGVHNVDLLITTPVTFKHDLATVGREASADIDAGRTGQLERRASTARRNFVNIGVARDRHRIQDCLAIGRPARRESRVFRLCNQPLSPTPNIINVDARIAVDIAQVKDRLVVR